MHLMEKMTDETGDEIPELEKVTIWYRCSICSGYLYSIPELKRHAATVHQEPWMEIPKNLPPGAEEGKVYYTYNLSFNKAPPVAYRYEDHANQPTALFLTSRETPNSLEDDYGIRIRQLEELQENERSTDKENIAEIQCDAAQERKSRNESPNPFGTPVVSPPDSGIQMHDAISEFQDEEPQPSQSVPESFTSTPTIGPVAKSQNVKLQCPHCVKKFNNMPSLNFHLKKFHQTNEDKPKEPEVRSVPVVLKIHRDTTTGNFVSSSSSKIKPPESHATASTSKRTRKLSTSSDESVETTLFPRKKKLNSIQRKFTPEPEINQPPPRTQLAKRKPGPKSRTCFKDMAASDSELEENLPSSTRSRRSSKVISSSESSAQESEDHSESELSLSSPVIPKRRSLRQVRQRRKESSPESDKSNSPIARKTRSRVTKEKSPTPNESESESELGTGSEDEENEESEKSEDELSDRSTTPEGSIVPPGSDDDNDAKSKKHAKAKKEDAVSEESYSSSDSEDLFIAVTVKKSKSSKKKNKSGESDKKDDKPKISEKEVAKKTTSETKTLNEEDPSASPVVCKLCSHECANGVVYISHLYAKHKKDDVPYDCGYCHKLFSTKQNVKEFNAHIRIHTDEIELEKASK